MEKIYTSCIDLYEKDNFASYMQLDDKFIDWIDKTCLNLISKSTLSEKKFLEVMNCSNTIVVEQVFFLIKGKSYFLDFFLPEYMVAIEIDGTSHVGKFCNDYKRDNLFRSIGIETIRITNRDVYNKDLKFYISDLVQKAFKGEYDISSYYLTPNDNKYKGIMTMNQKLLDECYKIIKVSKNKDSILFSTDSTYLMFSINKPPKEGDNRDNLQQIKNIHDLCADKGIIISVKFSGNRNNMNKYQKRHIEKIDIKNKSIKFNKKVKLFCKDVKGDRKL